MKQCLYCRSEIPNDATVCSVCRFAQIPGIRLGPSDDRVAERVIGIIDALVKWLAIPLTLLAVLGGVFGIKQIADIYKAKNEVERTLAILRDSKKSLELLLVRTVKFEADALLEAYSLDSRAADFATRVQEMKALIASLESLLGTIPTETEDQIQVARALIDYKLKNYKNVIDRLGDPPRLDGVWERFLLAGAYSELGNPKKDIEHTSKMVQLARDRVVAARAEQNLAAAYCDNGQPQKGIEVLDESLKISNRAAGHLNLAACLEQRNQAGDIDRALRELGIAFDLGLCAPSKRLEEVVPKLMKRDRTQIEALIRKRGEC